MPESVGSGTMSARQGRVTAAVTRLTATRKRVARMKAQTGGQGAPGGAAHR